MPLKLPNELLWEVVRSLPFEPMVWADRPISYDFNRLLAKYMTHERIEAYFGVFERNNIFLINKKYKILILFFFSQIDDMLTALGRQQINAISLYQFYCANFQMNSANAFQAFFRDQRRIIPFNCC